MSTVLGCETRYSEEQVGAEVTFHPLGGGTFAVAVVRSRERTLGN